MISKGMRGRMRRWSAPSSTHPPPPPKNTLPYFVTEAERATIVSTPESPHEAAAIQTRRSRKAEREERKDITRVLTPQKTYEGGFGRPTSLVTTYRMEGGRRIERNHPMVAPPDAAYGPHTVFLLESRYPVHGGPNKTTQNEHIVGVCREADFPAVLKKYNSEKCGREVLQSMDNAVWPWKSKRPNQVKWWENDEDPAQLVEQALETEVRGAHISAPLNTTSLREAVGKVPVELLPHSLPSLPSAQRRAYHASASLRASDPGDASKPPRTSAEDRANIPASSWARPPKPSQDADDNVVPTYYIERKRQRDTIAERKEEEGGLMAELSAGILSEGIAAQTRVLPEKIPVEVTMPDGTVVHPSGFIPPTPETDFHPLASKVATEDDPMLTTVKIPWDEALSPSPEVLESTRAADSTPSSSTPKHTRSFHSSAVSRATEVSTPLALAPSPPAKAQSDELTAFRGKYLRTLHETPFWRPILSLTFTTRPIALTIARLSRGMERGTPFYTTVDPADRAHCSSFSSRMRSLRISRMQSLTSQITRKLQGEHGGVPGVRFSGSDKGRGIEGEALDAPIDASHRQIKVGVADWHPLAKEIKETFEYEAEENGARDVVQVFGLDEKGLRTDGVSWGERKFVPFKERDNRVTYT